MTFNPRRAMTHALLVAWALAPAALLGQPSKIERPPKRPPASQLPSDAPSQKQLEALSRLVPDDRLSLGGDWSGPRADGGRVAVHVDLKNDRATVELRWFNPDGGLVAQGRAANARVIQNFARFQITPEPPAPDQWTIQLKLEGDKARMTRFFERENEVVFLTPAAASGEAPPRAELKTAPPLRAGAAADKVVELAAFAGRQKSLPNACALSPDGRLLAMAAPDVDNEVVVIDIDAPREITRLRLAGAVNRVLFSPDGGVLLASSICADDLLQAGPGRQLAAWNTADWKRRAAVETPRNATMLSCSRDGGVAAVAGFVSSGQIGYLTVWDTRDGKQLAVLTRPHGWSAAAVTPAGDAVLLFPDGGEPRYESIALPGGAETPPVKLPEAFVAAAFTPDGRGVVGAGAKGNLHLCRWDGKALRPLTSFASAAGSPRALALVGAQYTVAAGFSEKACVYANKTSKLAFDFPATSATGVFSVGASADGSRLLTWSSEYVARVWKTSLVDAP